MSESKELTTNELYSMQRGQDGKFVSGRRIRDIGLPIGFYQENNTLIFNYYDASNKYITVLETEKKEEFSALLKECLSDFDRAMYSDKFNAFSELINKSMRLLDKNKPHIDSALESFIKNPFISSSKMDHDGLFATLSTFNTLDSLMDMHCQIIILSLLISYKYDSGYFPREENIFQHVDYILQQAKGALRGYLFDVDGAVPNDSEQSNIIYSRMAELIKNGKINEETFAILEDATSLSPFSILKQIIDDSKLINIGYSFPNVIFSMGMKSTILIPEMNIERPIIDNDINDNDNSIYNALITMYKKVKSVNDVKEYLLAFSSDNSKDTGAGEIVNTLLLKINITE